MFIYLFILRGPRRFWKPKNFYMMQKPRQTHCSHSEDLLVARVIKFLKFHIQFVHYELICGSDLLGKTVKSD